MSILAVPDAGLHLESPADALDFLPLQSFGLTLNDSVIEDMIKCVQKGQNIELSLGEDPTFHYGSQEHHIKSSSDSSDFDLYLLNTDESSTKAQRLPNPTMSILKVPSKCRVKPKIRVESVNAKTGKPLSVKSANARAGSSGPESDAESPANSYARDKANKSANSTSLVYGIPTQAKRTAKSSKKLLPTGKKAMASVMSSNGATRSLSASPALNCVKSPSINPAVTASQQVYEKNKDQRSTVVHELAVRDRDLEYLRSKWSGSESDLKTTLSKVADSVDGKRSMKKLYWKELDVWNYDYATQAERQSAIDNAVKAYDRQRLGTTAPEWERLLKKEDRGKGIVLSKLQATLAKGNITPLVKPKVDDGSSKNDSDESSKGKGGESMARSGSQSGAAKKAKGSDRDAQTKRLLSNNPKKPTDVVRKAPAKKAAKIAEKPQKILSEEFVQSSSSEDEALPTSISKPKPKPVEKAAEKWVERPAKKPAEKEPPAAKAKPKQIVRAPKRLISKPSANTTSSAKKRTREDDDSSSSSGTPLSKRVKTKETTKPLSNSLANGLKHRPSDASQASRTTTSSTVTYKKNTSPTKSSPLASSPPTNASDFDDNSNHSQSQHHNRSENHHSRTNGNHISTASKKRKDRDHDSEPSLMPPAKKSRVGREVLEKALKFEMFYKSYENLHYDIVDRDPPPTDELERLLEMRERLVELKAEITRQVAQIEAAA